ncbi:MAG: hypothetical protein N3J91_04125 [Verrucomicrobiae bacterium]|nr:hypothetical protein [Verrucomicrobiae bacterium]
MSLYLRQVFPQWVGLPEGERQQAVQELILSSLEGLSADARRPYLLALLEEFPVWSETDFEPRQPAATTFTSHASAGVEAVVEMMERGQMSSSNCQRIAAVLEKLGMGNRVRTDPSSVVDEALLLLQEKRVEAAKCRQMAAELEKQGLLSRVPQDPESLVNQLVTWKNQGLIDANRRKKLCQQLEAAGFLDRPATPSTGIPTAYRLSVSFAIWLDIYLRELWKQYVNHLPMPGVEGLAEALKGVEEGDSGSDCRDSFKRCMLILLSMLHYGASDDLLPDKCLVKKLAAKLRPEVIEEAAGRSMFQQAAANWSKYTEIYEEELGNLGATHNMFKVCVSEYLQRQGNSPQVQARIAELVNHWLTKINSTSQA